MKEDFLVYVWQFGLFSFNELKTTENEAIEIIDFGKRNNDAGPDFFDAKIKIGAILWAGNVEIHTKSSDWKKHKHQNDKAYENVILHVVLKDDKPVKRQNGTLLPTLKMQSRINAGLVFKWQEFLQSKNWIACEKQIDSIDTFTFLMWKERLIVERIEAKTKIIEDLLQFSKNDWDECFYIFLARAFGMKVNQIPFEFLAKSLPLKSILKHSHSQDEVQALFFGQAGFLEEESSNFYYNLLYANYLHLKQKFDLIPIQNQSWKFSKLRPANFPTIRIAQLAAIFQKNNQLFSAILDCKTIAEIKVLFEANIPDYWETHYTFEKTSAKKIKTIGNSFINSLIINAIVPFLFVFSKNTDKKLHLEPFEILNALKKENNAILKKFEALKIENENALDSQALLHLYKNYCQNKQCLKCAIGKKILND